MAKTDWTLTDTVKPDDFNNIGREINQLRTDVDHIEVPAASLTEAGIVQLSSSANSSSETLAATPRAVKTAYDAAAAAQNTANAANTAAAAAQATANAAKLAAAAAQTTANQAFQSGNERKAEVVAALVAKGIPASTSESWDSLIDKMDTISQGNMVSLTYTMPDLIYRLYQNLNVPFSEDRLILTIPAGATKVMFLSTGIKNTFLFSRTTELSMNSGASLQLGIKDRNNNFFPILSMSDAYGDPMYLYVHAFTVDLTGVIPSHYLSNLSGNNIENRTSITKPTNFDTSGEMHLVFRSNIKYKYDGYDVVITRRGDLRGTLLYA